MLDELARRLAIRKAKRLRGYLEEHPYLLLKRLGSAPDPFLLDRAIASLEEGWSSYDRFARHQRWNPKGIESLTLLAEFVKRGEASLKEVALQGADASLNLVGIYSSILGFFSTLATLLPPLTLLWLTRKRAYSRLMAPLRGT